MHKANHFKLKPAAKPLSGTAEKRSLATEQIGSKMTSPTLVEFRNQNSQVPEWRLQLQNAVQQRMKSSEKSHGIERAPDASRGGTPDGETGNSESAEPAGTRGQIDNRYLSNALKRIESSRNRYLVPEDTKEDRKATPDHPKKEFPFTIAARTENPKTDNSTPAVEVPEKPKLVKKKLLIKDLYDTSELDPEFPPAKLSSSFDSIPVAARETKDPEPQKTRIEPKAEIPVFKAPPAEISEYDPVPEPEAPEALPEIAADPEQQAAETVSEEEGIEEYDDYASLSLRFNAGIFDFLIGSFLSFVLLLPFIFAGGSWFTFTGVLAFAATCAIVMFIYLTASVGLAGKSFGMHIFSLEMIDIGGENYPTFHQSAVSAAVYLVSMACLGVGFATAFFDRDRRAAHDLLSRTLVVREL